MEVGLAEFPDDALMKRGDGDYAPRWLVRAELERNRAKSERTP